MTKIKTKRRIRQLKNKSTTPSLGQPLTSTTFTISDLPQEILDNIDNRYLNQLLNRQVNREWLYYGNPEEPIWEWWVSLYAPNHIWYVGEVFINGVPSTNPSSCSLECPDGGIDPWGVIQPPCASIYSDEHCDGNNNPTCDYWPFVFPFTHSDQFYPNYGMNTPDVWSGNADAIAVINKTMYSEQPIVIGVSIVNALPMAGCDRQKATELVYNAYDRTPAGSEPEYTSYGSPGLPQPCTYIDDLILWKASDGRFYKLSPESHSWIFRNPPEDYNSLPTIGLTPASCSNGQFIVSPTLSMFGGGLGINSAYAEPDGWIPWEFIGPISTDDGFDDNLLQATCDSIPHDECPDNYVWGLYEGICQCHYNFIAGNRIDCMHNHHGLVKDYNGSTVYDADNIEIGLGNEFSNHPNLPSENDLWCSSGDSPHENCGVGLCTDLGLVPGDSCDNYMTPWPSPSFDASCIDSGIPLSESSRTSTGRQQPQKQPTNIKFGQHPRIGKDGNPIRFDRFGKIIK